jgi:YfiH family protein
MGFSGLQHGFLTKRPSLDGFLELFPKAHEVVWMEQVHGRGIKVLTPTELGALGGKRQIMGVDGLITSLPQVFLLVRTADCVPLLIFDPISLAVGCAHAGWRGTAQDIQGGLIERFALDFGVPPKRLLVAIGPHIGKCCYEVQGDVAKIFQEKGLSSSLETRNDRIFLDLGKASKTLLERTGVRPENIEDLDLCTRCLGVSFASYRRDGYKKMENIGFIAKVDGFS